MSITLLHDNGPSGSGKFCVAADIGRRNYPLGRYDTVLDAATCMRRWVQGRGLCFAPDSARRVDVAQRSDAVCLTLDVWSKAEDDEYREKLAAQRRATLNAWYSDDTLHIDLREPLDAFPWLNEQP